MAQQKHIFPSCSGPLYKASFIDQPASAMQGSLEKVLVSCPQFSGKSNSMTSETRTSGESEQTERARRLFYRLVIWVLAALVMISMIATLLMWRVSKPPFVGEADLVRTTRPTAGLPPTDFLPTRLFWMYYQWKQEHHPSPVAWSFPAVSAPARSSIHGLLNQCMEVGGTQYFIEKNVAGGTLVFGSTNVLNGALWIDAVEFALQANKPEWWDPGKNGFRRENLVLLRHDSRTVLVLTEALAKDFVIRYPALKREASGGR